MATTRFGLEGYGVRRAGSFAGKHVLVATPAPGERTVYVREENRSVSVLAETRTVTVPTES